MTLRAIAWDFDGVLNRNIVDGRFVWSDNLKADLGIDPKELRDTFFVGRFKEVIRGQRDFLDALTEWCARYAPHVDPRSFMAYWFKKDARTDPETLALLRARPDLIHVIATNNEANRARYIMEDMGLAADVSRMFAAGPMKIAKPDAGFFAKIEAELNLFPEALLLVDDHEPNCIAAANRGWQVFHFTDGSHAKLAEVLAG